MKVKEKKIYQIPRNIGFEEEFTKLVRRITGCSQGNFSGGADFENETFKVFPYFYGACTCQYGNIKRMYEEKNSHTADCFHNDFLEIEEAYKNHQLYDQSNTLKVERLNDLNWLKRKHNVKVGETEDIRDACNCGYKEKWDGMKSSINHTETCPYSFPNFSFKETGLEIRIHKIFFKEAKSNKNVELPEFKKIIKKCIKSMGRN